MAIARELSVLQKSSPASENQQSESEPLAKIDFGKSYAQLKNDPITYQFILFYLDATRVFKIDRVLGPQKLNCLLIGLLAYQ